MRPRLDGGVPAVNGFTPDARRAVDGWAGACAVTWRSGGRKRGGFLAAEASSYGHSPPTPVSGDPDSLYTKYCSDQSAERRDEFNYQQYLDGIEPGAYAAYQACTTAASNDVQFQMLTSPTRDVLELVVLHRTITQGTQAVMSWSASDPVTCQWESFSGDGEVEATRRRALRENERTRLKCRRDSYNTDPVREPDFINVIRDGGNAVINVPWLKYSEQGVPYQTLEEIRRQTDIEIAGLRNEVQSITSPSRLAFGSLAQLFELYESLFLQGHEYRHTLNSSCGLQVTAFDRCFPHLVKLTRRGQQAGVPFNIQEEKPRIRSQLTGLGPYGIDE